MSTNLALVIDPTVQVSMIAAFASVIVALLGLLAEGMRRNHNALRAVKKDTRGTREQVENAHSTNLRDDIDTLMEKIEKVAEVANTLVEGQHQITIRVNQLRDDQHASRVDQAQERQERLAADQRIDQHIAAVAINSAQVAEALRKRESHLDHNPNHNL